MVRNCDVCDKEYEAKRSNSRYCSDTCRKRSQRSGGAVGGDELNERRPGGPVYEATLDRLARLQPANEAMAAQALALAFALDNAVVSPLSGSAAASLAREHRAALAECEKGAVHTDVVDELSERRKNRQRAS